MRGTPTFPAASMAAILLCVAALAPLLAAPAVAAASTSTGPADHPSVAGLYQDDEDGSIFRVTQAAGSASADSAMLNETCTGGNRTFVLKGAVDGNWFNGTMERCDPADHPLVVNCGTDPVWDTTFNATFTAGEIDGVRQGEYWVYDVAPNGSWENSTIDHYTNNTFTMTRLDCGIMSWDELANEYLTVPSHRDTEIALGKAFENGQKLAWTDGQLAPGGLKEHVDNFLANLAKWGYQGTINSAYRPILYQGHFANMRVCNLQMLHTAIDHPELAAYLADSVAAVNAEVTHHGIKAAAYDEAGLHILVPYVCYREPLTRCPHTDERAADITITPDDGSLDWIGAMYGMCRPYLHSHPPDRPHWEYIPGDPFSSPKCGDAGVGPGHAAINVQGNSPINLLLTDSAGNRIGYDPATQQDVNDFGAGVALYSGAGTHPQVIEVDPSAVVAGQYTVTGVGTGAGPYTVTLAASSDDGTVLDEMNSTGTASDGVAIAPLAYTLQSDYGPANPFVSGTQVAPGPGGPGFSVTAPSGPLVIGVDGSAGADALLYDAGDGVVALRVSGSAGTATVHLPAGAVSGNLTVRADGAPLQATVTSTATGSDLVIDVPQGTSIVTVQGTPPSAGGPPPTGGGAGPAGGSGLLVVALVVAIAVAALALWVVRSRRRPGKPAGAGGPPPAPAERPPGDGAAPPPR